MLQMMQRKIAYAIIIMIMIVTSRVWILVFLCLHFQTDPFNSFIIPSLPRQQIIPRQQHNPQKPSLSPS